MRPSTWSLTSIPLPAPDITRHNIPTCVPLHPFTTPFHCALSLHPCAGAAGVGPALEQVLAAAGTARRRRPLPREGRRCGAAPQSPGPPPCLPTLLSGRGHGIVRLVPPPSPPQPQQQQSGLESSNDVVVLALRDMGASPATQLRELTAARVQTSDWFLWVPSLQDALEAPFCSPRKGCGLPPDIAMQGATWGCYPGPASLDALLDWLHPKGAPSDAHLVYCAVTPCWKEVGSNLYWAMTV